MSNSDTSSSRTAALAREAPVARAAHSEGKGGGTLTATTIALPSLMSVAELGTYLGVASQTLYNWRSARQGPRGIRVGGRVRYRRSAVEAWLEQQEDGSNG
jgi:excisionase family DNA binding protein